MMRHQHGGETWLPMTQVIQACEQLLTPRHVQASRRLVQQEQARLCHQRSCDQRPAALTLRQDLPGRVSPVGQPHQLSETGGARPLFHAGFPTLHELNCAGDAGEDDFLDSAMRIHPVVRAYVADPRPELEHIHSPQAAARLRAARSQT